MKRIIRTALTAWLCIMALQVPAAAGNDTPITTSQLPATAQEFIRTNFPGQKVALAKIETEFMEKSYEVIFTNGTKVEFDRKGNWTDVDCKRSSVPTGIIPTQIATYINQNYPGCKVLKIEKESKEWEVELNNGLEITFNKKFQVTDID